MNWSTYQDITKNSPPHHLLEIALKQVKLRDKALDMGSGGFRDSRYLLSQFKKVIAIDKFQTLDIPPGIEFINTAFEEFNFPLSEYNLINAHFSLPFIDEKNFTEVWRRITNSLKPEGIFVGQLFGIHDEWNKQGKKMTFHTIDQVKNLLSGMEILKLVEEKKNGHLASGKPKYWHIFNIIAQKLS